MNDHHPVMVAEGEAGYETRDVNVRGILALAGVIALGVVLALGLAWYLWTRHERQAARADGASKNWVGTRELPLDVPRLQEKPIRDYAYYRLEQEQAATTYAWLDRQRGIVRIPVERAMELYLQRNAPPSWRPDEPHDEPLQDDSPANTP